MKIMERLNLSKNAIEKIDDNAFIYAQKLEYLDLSWNKLTTLKRLMGTGLQNLKVRLALLVIYSVTSVPSAVFQRRK